MEQGIVMLPTSVINSTSPAMTASHRQHRPSGLTLDTDSDGLLWRPVYLWQAVIIGFSGTLLTAFFICQIVVYVRYCSSRRKKVILVGKQVMTTTSRSRRRRPRSQKHVKTRQQLSRTGGLGMLRRSLSLIGRNKRHFSSNSVVTGSEAELACEYSTTSSEHYTRETVDSVYQFTSSLFLVDPRAMSQLTATSLTSQSSSAPSGTSSPSSSSVDSGPLPGSISSSNISNISDNRSAKKKPKKMTRFALIHASPNKNRPPSSDSGSCEPETSPEQPDRVIIPKNDINRRRRNPRSQNATGEQSDLSLTSVSTCSVSTLNLCQQQKQLSAMHSITITNTF